MELGRAHAGLQYYQVFWGGKHGSTTVSELDIEPTKASRKPSGSFLANDFGGYGDFLRLIVQQRLSRSVPLHNNIYAFNASRTRFYPYQFKPLIKFLDSPAHRLLICDEVGLGKTIEAGLILTELRARQTVRRVLVVCPANLTSKWRLELKRRFGEDFSILNAKTFLEFLDEFESDPDKTVLNGILSLESARQGALVERLQAVAPELDLLVFDEAHHMRNTDTKTRRAGATLAASASGVLMLTATPIHLGNDNLFSLLNILDEEDFPDRWTADTRFRENEPVVKAQICVSHLPPKIEDCIDLLDSCKNSSWFRTNLLYADVLMRLQKLRGESVEANGFRSQVITIQKDLAELNLLGHIFTRTRKREVHTDVPKRRSHAVEVTLSEQERAFYDAVTNYVRAECEAEGNLPFIAQWRLNMPQRRMASCIPAMVEYYKTQLGLDPTDDSEDSDFVSSAAEDSESLTFDLNAARRRLQNIILKWPAEAHDSKYAQFLHTLRETRVARGEGFKAIVFAFFKDTLRYLGDRLKKDGFSALIISGDVPANERPAIIETFHDDPTVELLLSSRVGGEGLDFQFCDTMFNYDLPWNPMEVEQRIGRLDRIGQESPVIHIYSLWVERSIEERILRRLYDRIAIFERSIGGLEVILGDIARQLETDIFSKSLSPEEETQRCERALWALENRLKDLERLESEAARFVGTDQYFNDEVQAISQRKRYVTGEQLRRYVIDFIRRIAPKTRLDYDEKEQSGRLILDDVLKAFLQDRGKASEASHLLVSGPKGIGVTFDSQSAFRNPKLEFINVLHPLVSAINEEYEKGASVWTNAHQVSLTSDRLAKGIYYYFVFRLRIQGAKPRNTLEFVLLDQHLKEVTDTEVSETVFAEMVETGHDNMVPLELDENVATDAVEHATDSFLARLKTLREEHERANELFLKNRLASLNAFYGKNIKRQEELLQRARDGIRQERYIRMVEGTLRRYRAELHAKTRELEQQRAVEVSYEEVAAGILELV